MTMRDGGTIDRHHLTLPSPLPRTSLLQRNNETIPTPDSGVSSTSGSICNSAAIKSRSSSSPASMIRDCNEFTGAFQYYETRNCAISPGWSTSRVSPPCISEHVHPCAAATASQLRSLMAALLGHLQDGARPRNRQSALAVEHAVLECGHGSPWGCTACVIRVQLLPVQACYSASRGAIMPGHENVHEAL